MSPLRVTPMAARAFLLRVQGIGSPYRDIASALDHLGYVQIDPLNICGRMHDLILRNRVVGYREGDLMRHVHGSAGEGDSSAVSPPTRLAGHERVAFEHHHPATHVLVAFPLDAWPHLLAAMRTRARQPGAWSGRLTPRERALVPDLLAEIAAHGPLGSEDFADRRKSHRVVWGAATLVKSTLQKLFFHGRLLIAERYRGRRRYDLPERLLPPEILARPEVPVADTARWLVLLKLRQRRLVILKHDERRLAGEAAREILIAGCPPLHCLNEDVPLLESFSGARANAPLSAAGLTSPVPIAEAPTRLLAPLDPLIYDRRVTRALWNFDYTWEAYTPAAKRIRGHYALPILVGTELVGHVEPKADRSTRRLVIGSRSIRRGYGVSEALDELARWLGLDR